MLQTLGEFWMHAKGGPYSRNEVSGVLHWITFNTTHFCLFSEKVFVYSNFYYILSLKGVLYPWALFLKTLCIFSKNKATLDKVSYGSGQKCSKELKNHSFTSVETIVVKLQ